MKVEKAVQGKEKLEMYKPKFKQVNLFKTVPGLQTMMKVVYGLSNTDSGEFVLTLHSNF